MTQPWPAPPPVRTRMWPIAALAILAVILAVAALIVALNRPEANSGPTYTAAQKAEAKAQLCGSYKLAAQAVAIETNATDNIALARISDTNGAAMLMAASNDPALDSKYRSAALDLAHAYQSVVAISSSNSVDDPQFRDAIDNSNVKDHAMKELCGD